MSGFEDKLSRLGRAVDDRVYAYRARRAFGSGKPSIASRLSDWWVRTRDDAKYNLDTMRAKQRDIDLEPAKRTPVFITIIIAACILTACITYFVVGGGGNSSTVMVGVKGAPGTQQVDQSTLPPGLATPTIKLADRPSGASQSAPAATSDSQDGTTSSGPTTGKPSPLPASTPIRAKPPSDPQ
ncbi:MAG: hypothetical protein KGS45_09725 [Planctomycetes bacterium]|nr:hypothetical protein [Planctomycetota bacterium]